MSDLLPPFPTDDETLGLLDAALDVTTTGRSSLVALLDMLSGFDPRRFQPVAPGVWEYPEPVYDSHDVIAALVAEVRRLRALVPDG